MRVLVGTATGLYSVGDGSVAFEGRSVTAIANGRDGRWAILDGASLWRDDGSSWELVAETPGLRLNCMLQAAGAIWVGTAEAHLLRLDDERLESVTSFDHVDRRASWYTPWGGPPDVRSLSAGPDDAVYANVHVGGITRSADRGTTWSPTIDIDTDVHRVLAHNGAPGVVFAALGAGGLGVTSDGGETWSFVTEGLHATYCRAVAIAGEWLILSASAGPRGGRSALYRRPIEGGSFQRCTSGLPEWFRPNIDSLCLDARGATAAFGTEDGEVYVSSDSGGTWDLVARDLPPVQCVLVAAER
jgi:hypothetical protein